MAGFRRSHLVRWTLVVWSLLLLAAVRAAAPEETDPYWSARAGLENLAGMPLVRPDTWSWSLPGGDWYPNSPAWNLVLGWGWQRAGFWGLFWAAFGSILGFLLLSLLAAAKLGIRPLPGLAGMLLAVFAGFPMLSARATLVVHSLILLGVLFGAWAGPRLARGPLGVAAAVVGLAGFTLSAAGNWVHLSFLAVSAAFVVLWALQWWLTPGLGTARRVALTVTGALGLVGGVLLSPYGPALTLARSAAVQQACAGLILEWSPFWVAPSPQWWVVAPLAVAFALGALSWSWRTWRSAPDDPRVRIVAPLAVLALPAALVGLASLRFTGVSLCVLLPFAGLLGTLGADAAQRRVRRAVRGPLATARAAEYTSGPLWTVVLSVVAILLTPLAALLTSRGAVPAEQDLIDRLPQGCNLFSSPSVAAPVVLTRPDVKIWLDGRADYFGRNQLLAAYRVMAGTDPVPAGAGCVLLEDPTTDPLTTGAVTRLQDDPHWRQVADTGAFRLWLPAGA